MLANFFIMFFSNIMICEISLMKHGLKKLIDAIFRLYQNENMLLFNEIMMMSTLS